MRKKIKDLSRKELLEMLLAQEKEIEQLNNERDMLKKELSNRKIKMQNVGSFAEAMLLLNGVYDDVDKAAQEYLKNIQERENESKRILQEALQKAEEIVANAERISESRTNEADKYIEKLKFFKN